MDKGLTDKIEQLQRELDRIGIFWPGQDASVRDRLILALVIKTPHKEMPTYFLREILVDLRVIYSHSTEFMELPVDEGLAFIERLDTEIVEIDKGLKKLSPRARAGSMFDPTGHNDNGQFDDRDPE